MRTMTARICTILTLLGLGLVAKGTSAYALPNFASQTGQPCTGCHVGAFGPQLTPFGRAFKIGGYTQQGGDGIAAQIPLSAMTLTSFNHTASGFPEGSAPAYFGSNDNFALDQISIFLAGRITDWAGGFVQATYSGISRTYHLDQVDIRPFTKAFDMKGTELRVGVTVNNAPTVQDPFNSTFAWGFPYVFSGIAPQPAVQPLLAGGFAGNSVGITAYAWYDRAFYVEAGGYSTLSPSTLSTFGTFYGPGATQGLAPYLRAAYEWNWNGQSAHVGALFMHASVNPVVSGRMTDGSNGHDGYTDFGIDSGYQFFGDGTHTVSVYGIYVHENRTLNGSTTAANLANGTSFGSGASIDHVRIETSYWYQNTYGLTLGWQGTWGSATPAIRTPNPVTGSANGKPDTNAFLIEADWVPFGKENSWGAPYANLKLGIQYIAYTKFNGSSSNYDGFGRNASDNNTLYAFLWLAF
jgi:hypothetical protein